MELLDIFVQFSEEVATADEKEFSVQSLVRQFIELIGPFEESFEDVQQDWVGESEQEYFVKSLEEHKDYCKLVDERFNVTRYFFGPLVDKKPHGFGYARIEGGVRLAMLRGFFYHGVFRFG